MESTSIEFWQAAISLVLVALAVGLSLWRGLGVERQLLVASVRAVVQLLAVGYLLVVILEHGSALWLAWLWVLAMVAITSFVARRRAPSIPGAASLAFVTVFATTAVSLAVVFGLGVLEYTPIGLIVIAGITIGNTLPAVVLASKRLVSSVSNDAATIEGLLALGFDRRGVVRFVGRDIARDALIPQIERTNVVGLIALPGAMTGLLLAGVDPVDAVLIQLVVMYLILGAVATAVTITVIVGLGRFLTPDLRLRRDAETRSS